MVKGGGGVLNVQETSTQICVLNMLIDIQISTELIQMSTDKMMTYGTFTMDDEKLTQSLLNITELVD